MASFPEVSSCLSAAWVVPPTHHCGKVGKAPSDLAQSLQPGMGSVLPQA